MCGIAGLIHRKKTGDIGTEMTKMLVSLKHRGPDSTGFALYGKPKGNELVLRFKVAEQEDMAKGFDIHQQVKDRRTEVDKRLTELGAKILKEEEATEYAFRYRIEYDGDRRKLADYHRGYRWRRDPVDGPWPRADQGSGRRHSRLRAVSSQGLQRQPCHRPYPHGDGIGRRYPFRAPLLGLSVRRRVRRA